MIEWDHIASAPKGLRVLLYFPTLPTWARVQCWVWDDNRYAKRKRLYWCCDKASHFGTNFIRSHHPTHWAEINEPLGVTE